MVELFRNCLFLKVPDEPLPPESDFQRSHIVLLNLLRYLIPSEKTKTILRSHIGSNLMLPQSGLALINSIMSLFDVKLNKTQRGMLPHVMHPPTRKLWWGVIMKAAEATCWRSHGQPISFRLCWFPSSQISLNLLPSLSDLYLGRVFLVRCPLPWQLITSFLQSVRPAYPYTMSFSKRLHIKERVPLMYVSTS